MKKYLLRYLVFWVPAVLVSYFYHNASVASQVLQWFCAFFMVFGWGVNTAMAAYHYPRKTLAALLCYAGIMTILNVALYSVPYGSIGSHFLYRYGGLFSYQPLDIFIMAILDFNIMHEMYVTGFVAGMCLFGYIAGVFYRWHKPNPYRPRMQG